MNPSLNGKQWLDFSAINNAALRQLPQLLSEWLPNGRRQGREYVSVNPTRSDRRPGSFSVNVITSKWSDFATGDTGGDVVSLYAYLKGLEQVEAARELAGQPGIVAGLADVAGANGNTARPDADWTPIIPVPDDAPKLKDDLVQRLAPAGLSLSAGYWYRTETDALVGAVVRYAGQQDGKPAKSFKPFMYCVAPDGRRQWRCRGFPSPRPLYGAEMLRKRQDASVIVVEGEKSANASDKIFQNYVAVTSLNGSYSVQKTDWSPLAGRDVTIWPDADGAGTRYAADVVDVLKKVGAKSIRLVQIPHGVPESWDIADPLPEGMKSVDLVRVLAEAKLVTSDSPATDGPLPLFPELPPAEPYPIEALGPVLSRAAASIARKIQAPEAIAAQSVLAAAAIAAQAHANVKLPYGQTRPLSLFLVTVAKSGDRKSSADNEASWPIVRREKVLREQNTEDMKIWRVEHGAWSAQKKKVESDGKLDLKARKDKLADLGEEPPRPLAPFLTSGDLTIEGLTKNWPSAHGALGVFSAEAGQFTGGHAMADDTRLRTAAILSELWDGKPIKRVRAVDGVSILPGRRLSMHLLVQPDAAAGFLANPTLRDQGLLSRMLVAAPDSMAGTRFYKDTDPKDETAIHTYGARVLAILEAALPLVDGSQNELDPQELTISPEATKAWRQFYDHIERQCGSADNLKPIVDFAAKAAEHAARIAGVLTIVEDLRATEIGITAMTNALTLADWYVTEALRLHAGARMDPKLMRAAGLLEWLQSRGTDDITFRELLQFGPGPVRIKQAAEETLDLLIKHGWVTEISVRPRKLRVMAAEGTR